MATRKFARDFMAKGHGEREALRLAREYMKRTSGNRIRAGYSYNPAGDGIAERNREHVEKIKRDNENAKDDAEITAARARGRIIV